MRIKHHYCLQDKAGLTRFLDKLEIPYELCEEPAIKHTSYSFDLYEDQEAYEKFKIQFPFTSRLDSIKSYEYSKEEIEKAEWLSVRNISTKVQWEYDESAFRQSCPYRRPLIKELYYRHLEQEDILSVTKPVKWGTRQFFSGPNAANDIIFCSEKAKILLDNQWKGLEFRNVKRYKSSEYIADLYQLFFLESLPIEALSGGKVIRCTGCGRKIIKLTREMQNLKIKKQYLEDKMKVYKTGEVLTVPLGRCETFSLYIVSHEFYRYCEERKMNRGMVYEPISLL